MSVRYCFLCRLAMKWVVALIYVVAGEDIYSPLPRLRNIACGLSGRCIDLRTLGRAIGGPVLRGFETSGIYNLQKALGDVLERGHDTFVGSIITDGLIDALEMEPIFGTIEQTVKNVKSPFAITEYGSELNEHIKGVLESSIFENLDILASKPEVSFVNLSNSFQDTRKRREKIACMISGGILPGC